jgi:hypothetical protein
MKRLLPVVAAASLLATGAFAQTTPPAATPEPNTTEKPMIKPAPSTTTTPSTTTSPSTTTTPSTTMAPSTMDAKPLVLSDAEAKAWVDKVVYSSDGMNLGEVAAFARDASGKVTEMHADMGGFLGIGETRVRLMPAQFKVEGDRVVLNMTAEQAKALPKIAKN